MSNTTIQLKKSTVNKLKTLKEELNLRSYDEVIENLIKEEQQISDSMFGKFKGKIKPFVREYDDHKPPKSTIN